MDTVYTSKVRGVGLDKVIWMPVRSIEVRGFYLSFYPPTLFFSFLISKKKFIDKKREGHPSTQGVYKEHRFVTFKPLKSRILTQIPQNPVLIPGMGKPK